MIFLMILLLFTKAAITTESNVGSVIFYKRSSEECWTQDDLAKLHARKIFENVVLPSPPPDKINIKNTRDTLKYFRRALREVAKTNDLHTGQILGDALADTLGGHMRHELLPNARFAYYAGYIPFRSVRQLHKFYDELKVHLNTQGIGWQRPEKAPFQSNLTVSKILIGAGRAFDPCAFLVVKRDNNNCIHVPMPKLDDEESPSALALPFKAGSFISLTAPTSENVLLKYYTTAARCILRSSPEECRHSDFVNFNNELWHWMKRNVAPHLLDENLYAAYGGILRIAAAVQNYGKGLSRRTLYESDYPSNTKWHPLRTLSDKYYMNADWTPQLYIAIVMGSALAVCCLHICYNLVLGRKSGCRCPGRQKIEGSQREVAYAHVDSTFPAMLPSHSTPTTVEKRTLSRSKSASVGTARTQRVYDFNENAEKIMSVIMSDNEGSELESSSSNASEEETANGTVVASSAQTEAPPASPPRIDAPLTQLKIEKAAKEERSRRMYSTSTVTQSEVTYCGRASDTAWSGSYTTDHTASSLSTKSRTQQSRRSRDLAWARRVVSKQTLRDTPKSTTGTDLDLNSFTTPPSRR